MPCLYTPTMDKAEEISMRVILFILLSILVTQVSAQPNCAT